MLFRSFIRLFVYFIFLFCTEFRSIFIFFVFFFSKKKTRNTRSLYAKWNASFFIKHKKKKKNNYICNHHCSNPLTHSASQSISKYNNHHILQVKRLLSYLWLLLLLLFIFWHCNIFFCCSQPFLWCWWADGVRLPLLSWLKPWRRKEMRNAFVYWNFYFL